MTTVEQLLGIAYPILQGAMANISTHKLVGPVSEAGGLGIIGAWLAVGRYLWQDDN